MDTLMNELISKLHVYFSTWLISLITLFVGDYVGYIDVAGKIILILLGIIAGIGVVKTTRLKRKEAQVECDKSFIEHKRAQIELEISQMKLQEEINKPKKR